jgi:hypothetical protein
VSFRAGKVCTCRIHAGSAPDQPWRIGMNADDMPGARTTGNPCPLRRSSEKACTHGSKKPYLSGGQAFMFFARSGGIANRQRTQRERAWI